MMKGEAKGTAHQRVGCGIAKSFRKAWPLPGLLQDEAADAKLDQLIEQLEQVNWPKQH